VLVAESIRHPGYWHVHVMDFRPLNYVDASSNFGTRRPVAAKYLALAFAWMIRSENLHSDQFAWIDGESGIEGVRRFCDDEAALLAGTHNFWWRSRQGGKTNLGGRYD